MWTRRSRHPGGGTEAAHDYWDWDAPLTEGAASSLVPRWCRCQKKLGGHQKLVIVGASKQASKQAKPSSAARSLAVSAPAMLTAASCGAGTIETAVTSATEAAVVVVVVHIWMKIGTGPVEHLCPRHASHIYGGRGDALGAPLDPRGPQRRRHHLRSCTGAFRVRAATSAPCRGAPCACLCELREQLRPQTDALRASRAPPEPR